MRRSSQAGTLPKDKRHPARTSHPPAAGRAAFSGAAPAPCRLGPLGSLGSLEGRHAR
jgi:hypothetical protein